VSSVAAGPKGGRTPDMWCRDSGRGSRDGGSEPLIAHYRWTAIGFCVVIAVVFAVRAVSAFGAGDQQDAWVDSAFALGLLGLMVVAIARIVVARRRR
jgi:hypothetical protein